MIPTMTRKLYGQTPDQARSMCIEWYFRPLCSKIMADHPSIGSLFFLVRRSIGGDVLHTLVPGADPDSPGPRAWPPQSTTLQEAQEALFGGADIFDAQQFSAAFRPCCPPDGWGIIAIARRRQPPPTTVPLIVLEYRGYLFSPEEPWPTGLHPGTTGRPVADVQTDLALLDANAHVLWRLERLLDSVEAAQKDPRELASMEWALNYLRWSLEE